MSSRNELDLIIADALDRETSTPSDADLIEAHPHLAPELERRLSTLRQLREAACRAQSPLDSAPVSDHELEELRFLADVLPDYSFSDRIQMGGQGVVFEAVHKPTGRRVALKLLLDGPLASATQAERFEREVRVIARLNHPNIITLFDAGVIRGRRYFSMAFVEGLPIDDHAHLHMLSVENILRLFVPVCRALAFAHGEGIIHRDIKPSNILIDGNGKPLVLDFGLAKDADPTSRSSRLSITGQVFGTMPYLSPDEVGLEEDGAGDHRADVYALGIVLYELLTGTYPYPVDGSAMRIRHNILFREPTPLRAALKQPEARLTPEDISDELEAVMGMALRKDPDQRYATADQLADDLERLLRGEAVTATRDTRLEGMRRILRRHRQQVAISLVLAASLAFSSLMWWRAESSARTAQQNARTAYSILKDNLEVTDETIRPLAGSTPARQRLLQTTSDMFSALDEEDGQSDLEVSVRALLFEREGDLAWQAGDWDAARDKYDSFLGAIMSIDDGVSQDITADLIRARTKLARVSEQPLAEFATAINLGLPHMDRIDLHPELQFATIQAHVDLVQHLFAEGRMCEAHETARTALTLAEGTRELVRLEARWAEAVANAHAFTGRSGIRIGRIADSIQYLDQSIRIREDACVRWPADVYMRHELLVALRQYGETLYRRDMIAEAQGLFERAATIGQYLLMADPSSTRWRSSYASAEIDVSRILLKQGLIRQAELRARRSIEHFDELLQTAPADLFCLAQAADAYGHLGRVLIHKKQYDEAILTLGNALDLARDRTILAPESPDARSDLAYKLDRMAQAYRKKKQFEDARACYQESMDIRASLLHRQPEVVQRHLDLINSKSNFVTLFMSMRDKGLEHEARDILLETSDRLDLMLDTGLLDGDIEKYMRYKKTLIGNLRILNRRIESSRTAAR